MFPYKIETDFPFELVTGYSTDVGNSTNVDNGRASMKSFSPKVYMTICSLMILASLAFYELRKIRKSPPIHSWHSSVFGSFAHLFLFDFEGFDYAVESILSVTHIRRIHANPLLVKLNVDRLGRRA